MKVLLHTCCAPCSIECIEMLSEYEVSLYWYNPNIHPFIEYKNRLEGIKEYSKLIGIDVVYNDTYGLREFTKSVVDNIDGRCDYCYRERLEETAKYASLNGYEGFSTSLLVSPYQNHEKIKSICEELSKKYNIRFIYKDFRENFRKGQNKARELGIYMQKYCGCIFSEEERYRGKV